MIKSFRKMVILLILIFLLACSGRNPYKIMVWHSFRPSDRILLREALAEFEQNYPDWEFGELYYQNETARTNYIISALGGSGPALFRGANDNIGPFVEMEVIQPLEPFLDKDFLDNFLSKPIEANTWMNEHLYQVADQVGNHLCLVYNKALISSPPQTMNELIKFGKKFTVDKDGDGKPDQYALVWNYTEPFFVVPFIGGFGGWIVDENYQPTLNNEAVVKAATFIYDLANKHKIIPLECDYEIATALFKDQYAAMIINGSWSWGSYIENGIDIGIARIPKIDETGLWPTPAISPLGYSLNVNVTGEKRDITIELLKFLTSADIQLRFTSVSGSIPARKDAFNDPLVKQNPIVSASLDQLLEGRIMPPVTEMRWIWDAMRPSYQGIFTGNVTPQQAAQEMQELAVKLIKENRE
jgi:arabinogalactan oligomer / maltooligosaccharide transport system permease protein